MTDEESTAFKKEVKPHLQAIISLNGGIDHVQDVYRSMPSFLDFIAGCTTALVADRRAPKSHFGCSWLSQEEVRRIYDLVRLRLDTESSTS